MGRKTRPAASPFAPPDSPSDRLLASNTPSTPPLYFLLFYEGVEDYAQVRVPWRPAHLQLARESHARGELVQAGALVQPTDGSVLLFRGDSAEVAERFARDDPFVREGVVKRWYVREWTTVIGPDATVPTIGI